MNQQELFLVILAAFVIGNVVNKLIVNPLIYKLQNTLFGNRNVRSQNIAGSAQSESSIIVK